MSWNLVILIVIAVFVGALVRATFGFGEAVVSMPLLALLPVDLYTSISLIGLAGLTVALFTVISGWRDVDLPALIRMVIGALLGIPIGLIFVVQLPAGIITIGLGCFLIVYSIYSLSPYKAINPKFTAPFWAMPAGVISGILGSAYNTHGVPIVVYGTLKRWEPKRFRGTLQAHFLVTGALIVAGQAMGGLWSKELFKLFGFALPAIIIATLLGLFLQRRIPNEKFEQYVFVLLVILGGLLLVNTI